MRSVIYISRSRIEELDRTRVLDDLQAELMARSSTLDITGLLVATPDFFVERLDGPAKNVDAVMASILADQRYHDVRIVHQEDIIVSRFKNWRMLRLGGDSAGTSGIADVIATAHERGDPLAVRRLERLIDVLADGHAGAKV